MSGDDEGIPTADPATLGKLKRGSFRCVLPAEDGAEVLPVATVALDSSGALIISPVDVGGHSWSYGIVRTERAGTDAEVATTTELPKLIWHESGEVHASLSGSNISPRRLMLSRFDAVGSQVLSIVACWPLAFVKPKPERKRDLRMYPAQTGGQSRSVPAVIGVQLHLRAPRMGEDWYYNELGPIGLIKGDPSRFVISLSGYGRDFVVEGFFRYDTDGAPNDQPGITVGARDGGISAQDEIGYALWTSTQRNPQLM